MEVFIILALFVATIYLWKDNNKLNRQIISLHGIINGTRIEKNILENRLDLLERLEGLDYVQEEE